jgi:MoaA/NifB/PqqE/SkfB family radical SAM enzyme
MDDITWHIEPTSKCTLECPLCDRTWFYNTFKKRLLHEIDVGSLVKFFAGHKPKINMCGNNGDPIYHSDFHNLVHKLKDIGSTIKITTNGSARKKDWWNDLGDILDSGDQITFSIDGLRDTNDIYRKNANWDSIMDAVESIKNKKVRMVWKFIVFKHNQHQIKDAMEVSKEKGFDEFRLEKSDRWLDNQDLMPSSQYVNDHYQHSQKVLGSKDYKTKIEPNCLIKDKPSNELYIDSEGNFFPCCWIGSYRYKFKSLFDPKLRRYNIRDNTIKTILENSEVKNFFMLTKSFDSAHECCKIKCGVKNA